MDSLRGEQALARRCLLTEKVAVENGTKRLMQSSSWRDLLPPSFAWIEKCKLQGGRAPAKAHYLVPYSVEIKDGERSLSCEAKLLSSETQQTLLALAKDLGILSKEGIFTLAYEGSAYTLVAQNSLPTSIPQKGAQLGLDFAHYLKGWQGLPLVIVASQEISALEIFSGLAQGFYQLASFKGKNHKSSFNLPDEIYLWDDGERTSSEQIHLARAMAQALTVTRMIEDAPPNWLNPEKFAEIAADIAKAGKISCSIKGGEEIKAMGMGAFYSVSQGSAFDAQLITLEIKGKDPSKTIALVGKGLTFDAGGISIKPSVGMAEMKYDMCGGGAVLGTAFFLSKVPPACNVVCLIGAVENVVGEQATRPGDIVQTMNGKTVEILNTDAEGRLVLCDLLHYAIENWQPAMMVDVATLTGAVLVALGSCGAGLVSNDQESAERVLGISRQVGEPLWQLPIWPELPQEMLSPIADLQNIPSPRVKAGTITAACFLREFVGETKWVHIDNAGTAYDCQAVGFPRSGASGFIVKTLAELCRQG